MVYNIPVSHLDKLQKQIQRIRNKGANITFNVGPEIYIEDDKIEGVFHKCNQVEVEGSYIINGWQFVATIEHGNGANIIRAVDDELAERIPDKYRTCDKECEHCHKIRDRKDTYLIYNQEGNYFKQVGKTCLKDYTKGLDAETCAQLAEVIHSCSYLRDDPDEDAFLGGGFRGPTYDYIRGDLARRLAYNYVKENGYIKNGGTASALADLIYKHSDEARPATDEEMAEINAWVDTLPLTNNYYWNAVTAWRKPYLEARDLGLVGSLIFTFFKEQNEIAKKKAEADRLAADTANVYVGQEGDRITFEVAKARLLYVKSNGHKSYYAPDSYVMEIIDTDGHIYIWSASINNINPGDKITATIKGYKEFRGKHQTVITRGKVERPNGGREEEEEMEEDLKLKEDYTKPFFCFMKPSYAVHKYYPEQIFSANYPECIKDAEAVFLVNSDLAYVKTKDGAWHKLDEVDKELEVTEITVKDLPQDLVD